MVCRGIIKNGRVELEAGVQLPEGSVVKVEPLEPDWLAEWDGLAREVAEASPGSESVLDTLAETRR